MADQKISALSVLAPTYGTSIPAIDLGSPTQNFRMNYAAARSWLGIPRIDAKMRHRAFFDAATHPLSSRYASHTAARVDYPNVGIAADGSNWATAQTWEIDWAALQQGCYDAANGNGGIVGLPVGISASNFGRINQSVDLIDASKCWLHGGPRTGLMTEGCGTSPAVIVGAPGNWTDRTIAEPLRDITFYAWNSGPVGAPTNTAGVAHSVFRAGSVGAHFLRSHSLRVVGCRFNGFDTPYTYDDCWGIESNNCSFAEGNRGASWLPKASNAAPAGERLLFYSCDLNNNNYGVWCEAIDDLGNSVQVTMFLQNCALDYNIVRHIYHVNLSGSNQSMMGSLDVSGSHIETGSECSGTLSRIYSNGNLSMRGNHVWDKGPSYPPGWIEVGAQGRATATDNRIMMPDGTPVFYYNGTADLQVMGAGNSLQGPAPTPLLKTNTGLVMQGPKFQPAIAWTGGNDYGTPLDYQNRRILITEGSGVNTNITVSPDSTADHANFTELLFTTINEGTGTFVAGSGVFLNKASAKTLTFGGVGKVGAVVRALKTGDNSWTLTGDLN